MPLEWGNSTHIDQISNIDTILGPELAYDKGCVDKLMKTLIFYKKKPKSKNHDKLPKLQRGRKKY